MTFEGTTRHIPDAGVGIARVPQHPDDEDPETAASLDVGLVIVGQQYGDGRTDRGILIVPLSSGETPDFVPDDCDCLVSLDGAELDADGARRLSAALIAAADELDKLKRATS